MSRSRRVVGPESARSPNYGLRAFLILLLLAAIASAAGSAYWLGLQHERQIFTPMIDNMNVIAQERDALSAQVMELRQQSIIQERSQQIDREANRAAAEQLKKAQDERLALEKEVSFLRRLVQEGGGGILQPKDFKLKSTPAPGEFGYSFTIQQLIQDFGESTGSVDLQIIGKRNGAEARLALSKLKGSKPKRHQMRFKHFQSFEGSIHIPEDFEPESLVVEIKPRTANLIPVSETFPWNPEQ